MNQNRFYKGNRVLYTSGLMPRYTNREGEVTGQLGGLVQVRFDGETTSTGCFEASLKKLRRTPAHIERRDRLLQRYGS